jgi:hypothetical protein
MLVIYSEKLLLLFSIWFQTFEMIHFSSLVQNNFNIILTDEMLFLMLLNNLLLHYNLTFSASDE